MPSFFQLLVIVVVALIVIVIWRMVRSGPARDENARRLSQEHERRTAQRRVEPERRQSVRPDPERRQGAGRRAEDQSD